MTTFADPAAQLMYATYKRAWLAQERRKRERQTPATPLVEPVDSWQIWKTDPQDVPALIDGLEPSTDYAWTKMHLQDDAPTIGGVLAFRPGVIFSAGGIHARGRAWVCPLTGKTASPIPGAVPVQNGGYPGMALPAFARTVSTNTGRDTRELVCTHGVLPREHQLPLLESILDLLAGKLADPSALSAGALISLDTPWGVLFGLVLAGFIVRWSVPVREVPFALIVQKLGDSSILAGLSADEAARLGLVIARTETAPAIFALTTLRVVPTADATVVGEARPAVEAAQNLILQFLAEEMP